MIQQVIIHVGIPKTGTTFLQKMVFPNIPKCFYWNNHQQLWNIIFNLPFRHSAFDDLTAKKARIDSIVDDISKHTLLISHESLFGHPWFNFANHEENTNLLHELFPESKIIVTIRKQDDFIESLYRHAIQVGFSQKLDRFLNYENGEFGRFSYNRGLNIDVNRLNYQYYIDYYVKIFGKENILVLPYEQLVSDLKEFLKKIYDFSSLQEYYPPPFTRRKNSALSFSASKLKYWLNPFFKHNQSNGFGFLPQQPFNKLLFKMAKKNPFFGYPYKISKMWTLLNFLRFIDPLFSSRGQWLDHEKRLKILEIHKIANMSIDKNYQLNLEKFGYY